MNPAPFILGYKIFLIVAFAACLFLLALAWRYRQARGSTALLIMLMGETLWIFFYVLQLWGFPHPFPDPYFWSKLTFLGVVMVPASFLAWSSIYTQRDAWLGKTAIVLLLVEPVVFNAMIWTDPWHGWFSGSFKTTGQLGIAFTLHTLYSYLLIFAGVAMQVRNLFQIQPAYRLQAYLLILALPVSIFSNILTIAFIETIKLDFSPIGFLVVAAALTYAQVRHKLFDILPVARHKVVDDMRDGLVVLDQDNRIIDINPAAKFILATSMKEARGLLAQAVIPIWNKLIERPFDQEQKTIEVTTDSGVVRHIDVEMSVMLNRLGQPAGRLVLLRDVTRIKNIEKALRETNEELLARIHEIEKLQEQLKEQAIRDPLTDLYNRRFLHETLEQELIRAERTKEPISLALIDLDHFKNINDTFGHDAGDFVLKALAKCLTQKMRQSDVACRYGGEEFLIIMPGAPLAVATTRIDSLRETFSAKTTVVGSHQITATFSAGLAAYPVSGKNENELLLAADKALYEAKAAGRNRVVALA